MYYDFSGGIEMLLNFMKEGALTFILVFTIVYFLLLTVPIFKKQQKEKFAKIIALLLAIAAITPHFTGTYYGWGETVDVVEIVNNALPSVSLLIIGIVMLLIVLAIFGKEFKFPTGTWWNGGILIFSLLAIIYIFARASGYLLTWDFLYWIDPELLNLIIVLIVFAAIISFISSEGSGGWGDKIKSFLTGAGDLVHDVVGGTE